MEYFYFSNDIKTILDEVSDHGHEARNIINARLKEILKDTPTRFFVDLEI